MDRDTQDGNAPSAMKKVRATEFSIKALMKETPQSTDKTPLLTTPTACMPADLAANQLMFNMALSQLQEKFLGTLRHRNSFYGQNHPAYAGALSSSLPGFVAPYCSGLPRPRLDLFHEYQNRQWYASTKRNHNLLSQHSGFDYPHGVLALSKPKRIRTAFSPNQLVQLEASFDGNPYVVGQERRDLAVRLGLTETQVKVWFQNRRTKEKRGKPEEDMLVESD